jgi:DNA phosphorothioation-associated putative methyltransferase
MARSDLSRPVQLLLHTGLLAAGQSLFDYGCGQGDDVRRLQQMGYKASGWDPHFTPNAPKSPADVVNLGFVLNVIERAQERLEVLREAWALSGEVMLVAVRSFSDTKTVPGRPYGDGYLTKIGTFQKFYDQLELKNFLTSGLGVKPVPLAPGIVALFRDEKRRQEFVSERFRRSVAVSSARRAHSLFESHTELFEALYLAHVALGRMPDASEWDRLNEAIEVAGTARKAFGVLRHVHGQDHLRAIADLRAEDLLVFLALERLEDRPRFGQLGDRVRRDVRAFFGTYKQACVEADRLLLSAGNPLLRDAACRDSAVGKLLPTAFFIHEAGLSQLEGVLRVVEGCARSLVGEIEGANVIKFGRRRPTVSYLCYPGFDRVAHPTLRFSVSVDLGALRATWHDFEVRENPPVLHRKELFVPLDYPGRAKFARLSRQEERAELLGRNDIGSADGWGRALREGGWRVVGHRLSSSTES